MFLKPTYHGVRAPTYQKYIHRGIWVPDILSTAHKIHLWCQKQPTSNEMYYFTFQFNQAPRWMGQLPLLSKAHIPH